MKVYYETEKQKTTVEAMRKHQAKRGLELTEIVMFKVFGVPRPTWAAIERLSKTRSRSKTYSIDGEGYDVYVCPR